MNDRIEAAQASVFVIGFDPADRLRWMSDRIEVPFPFLVDEDRDAYRAFGLERASWARTYLHPKVVTGYAGLLARGKRPDLHLGQDRQQLGGDFVIAPDGTLVLGHPERGPEDRAAAGLLVRAAEDAAGS